VRIGGVSIPIRALVVGGALLLGGCQPPLGQEGQNEAVFTRLLDASASGNLQLFDELCAPRYRYHAAGVSEPLTCQEHKQSIRALRASFSEYEQRLDDVFSVGDKLVFRMTVTATHTDDFLGIPATGNRVRYRVLGVVRIVNGLMLDAWIDQDWPALFDQIGTTPPAWHRRWSERLFDPLPPTP